MTSYSYGGWDMGNALVAIRVHVSGRVEFLILDYMDQLKFDQFNKTG